MKKYDSAIIYLQKSYDLLNIEIKKTKEKVRMVDRSVILNWIQINFNLGIAYYYLGNNNKACEYWKDAEKLKDAESHKYIQKYCE